MKSKIRVNSSATQVGARVIRPMAFLSLLVVAGPSSGCFWRERRDPDVYVERRRYDRDEHREREPRGERHEERHEERRHEEH